MSGGGTNPAGARRSVMSKISTIGTLPTLGRKDESGSSSKTESVFAKTALARGFVIGQKASMHLDLANGKSMIF